MAQKLGRVRAAQCGAHLCFRGGEGVAARGLINHVWLSKVARRGRVANAALVQIDKPCCEQLSVLAILRHCLRTSSNGAFVSVLGPLALGPLLWDIFWGEKHGRRSEEANPGQEGYPQARA